MNKQNIQKEIIETAKELGIGVYMVEEFITNPRILKFREVAIRNKEKEMLDDEITFLEDLLEYDTLDGTPTAISKYLREEELKQKAKATIEHMKQPHFINKKQEINSINSINSILKDIEKYKFNWSCDCKNCNNIRKIILQYNHDNKERK